MLHNEYNESSQDLETLESEQEKLLSTLSTLDSDFKELLSSLSIPAESLVGLSESLTKDQAITKVQSLGAFADRTLGPKLKEVTDSAKAIVADHEKAEK
jgi:hypothetical protein